MCFAQNQSLKKQQKEEMKNVDAVRVLSTEKDQLTHDLGAENESLRAMVDNVTAERDAFLSENEAVVRLLVDHGVHQSLNNSKKSATLQSSVEQLVTERERHRTNVEKEKKLLQAKVQTLYYWEK